MRTGQCLCGAVRFEASEFGEVGACHCVQCQRWTGGPLIAVSVPEAAMRVEGEVTVTRTSDWATRSRCASCGSPLWYRFDNGADRGPYEVALGLFDDANGLSLMREIYVDQKPDGFAFAGDHPRLTRAETRALYAPSSDGG